MNYNVEGPDVEDILTRGQVVKVCGRCNHDEDNHSLVATCDNNPMKGGVMLCPVKGCDCYATWGVQGAQPERIPDRFELERIREYVQS